MSSLNNGFLKQELMNFEISNICNICSSKFANPVRIKICGHYFCEQCLNTDEGDEQCPKCKEHYENNEVDYQNAARKVQKYLDELRMFFSEDEDDQDRNLGVSEPNTFIYNNRMYEIHFCDELIRKFNMKGESPLHIACKRKKIEDAVSLLKKETDINIQDFAGWTPLHEAVESESYEIVEALLNYGALVDVMGEDYTTPLHKAALLKNKKLIKLLLEYGASKDIVDFFGKKPIEYITDENLMRMFDLNSKLDRIQKLFLSKKITAFCYYIEVVYKEKLKSLKNAKLENDFNPKRVTHFFIRKTHKISVKIFVAMLYGCLIVPQEYIDNIISDNYYIDFPNYLYINNIELNKGIQKAVLNSLLKMPSLFDGICFFIHGHKKRITVNQLKISKEELSSLITAGGGKILPRAPTPTTCQDIKSFPYHTTQGNSSNRCCHYIIYEEEDPPVPLYQMPDLKHKSSRWLIDCIINFTIKI